MKTRIVSAFPGTGKTHYYNNHKDTCLDSDSSQFSWVVVDGQRTRNPEFPQNYIQHIKDNIGKYEFILVSSHAEVRRSLKDNYLFYYLMFPESYDKENYMQRYRERGSDQSFIDLLNKNWNDWINSCELESYDDCQKIHIRSGRWLTDEIRHLIHAENCERK